MLSLEIKAAVVSEHADKEQQELLYELLVNGEFVEVQRGQGCPGVKVCQPTLQIKINHIIHAGLQARGLLTVDNEMGGWRTMLD